ncbi:MAG: DUF4405 domain-containing protein [Dissulfurispiraceae bacterium]|jgi:hypothetical protein|nr:DUF4405 domain-containing protein [Dissulfurispiraceae bacterium]
MQKKGFHKRGFISLVTAFSFIAMTVSGIVLYFTPHGRIAYWTDWKFALLTKNNWADMHVLTSLLFVVVAVWHLLLNWKVFLSYISRKLESAARLKRELAIAAVLTIVFTFGPVFSIPPFSYVIDFSEYLKMAWVTSSEYEPPFGHAEELSLKAFTRRTNIDLQSAMDELRKSGIKFDNSSESLQSIARANNKNAMEVFAIIKKFQKIDPIDTSLKFTPEMVEERFAGTGIGRKTLKQVTSENALDLNDALKKLEVKGIKIGENEAFKDAAARYDIYPLDLMKVILVEDYSPSK